MFSFPSCEIGFSDSQAQADCGDICFAGEVSEHLMELCSKFFFDAMLTSRLKELHVVLSNDNYKDWLKIILHNKVHKVLLRVLLTVDKLELYPELEAICITLLCDITCYVNEDQALQLYDGLQWILVLLNVWDRTAERNNSNRITVLVELSQCLLNLLLVHESFQEYLFVNGGLDRVVQVLNNTISPTILEVNCILIIAILTCGRSHLIIISFKVQLIPLLIRIFDGPHGELKSETEIRKQLVCIILLNITVAQSEQESNNRQLILNAIFDNHVLVENLLLCGLFPEVYYLLTNISMTNSLNHLNLLLLDNTIFIELTNHIEVNDYDDPCTKFLSNLCGCGSDVLQKVIDSNILELVIDYYSLDNMIYSCFVNAIVSSDKRQMLYFLQQNIVELFMADITGDRSLERKIYVMKVMVHISGIVNACEEQRTIFIESLLQIDKDKLCKEFVYMQFYSFIVGKLKKGHADAMYNNLLVCFEVLGEVSIKSEV